MNKIISNIVWVIYLIGLFAMGFVCLWLFGAIAIYIGFILIWGLIYCLIDDCISKKK
jgi:hypothetical protein